MSLDTTIYQILKAIDVAYENQNFNLKTTLDLEKLKISENRLNLLVEELTERGYIKGIIISRAMNNNIRYSFSNPRLTLVGLDYLENNSTMKKAYNTLKEIKGWIPGL